MSNEKTKWIFDDGEGADSGAGDVTRALDGGFPDSTQVGGDEPTVSIPAAERPVSDKTEIFTRGNADKFSGAATFDLDSDPVTGWLVVVRGPGLGQSIPLGTGMNSVGRGESARVSLPFGDRLISSDDHIRIIYDDAERTFLVSHGSGKNVSRVNGQLLANTLPLEDEAVIELSKVTRVMFKQFCDREFDWADLDLAKSSSDA